MHAKRDRGFAARLDSCVRCLQAAFAKGSASLCVAILIAFGMAGCHAERIASNRPQAGPAPGADLSGIASLPEPNDEAIRRTRTGEEWTNPSIAVNVDGYDLVMHGEFREARLNLVDLENALLRLPTQDWPLGRVVVVWENGIRSFGDEVPIRRNLEAVKRMLESHRVRVELLPSA